jgi:ATPase subunit of ABC transporter with duplicated ATPase domains
MSLLALCGVSFEFPSGAPLFEDVSITINPGDRIALVGPNGAGKTTFLHLLTGALEPTGGSIARRRGLRIAISEQSSRIAGQSGGEHSREQLARVFAADADLVILDEPTNHLDLDAREWLERKLARIRAAAIVASHDRAFLAAVANRVIEIERGNVHAYNTGYDEYRAMKQRQTAQQWAEYEGHARRKLAIESAARKRARLSAKVAKAPPGEKKSPFYLAKSAKVARTARILRERVNEPGAQVEKPWEEQGIGDVTFDNIRRAGDVVLTVEGLEARGLFEGLTFHLRRGDRLAITGANGSGKTTLLGMLAGQRRPDGGSIRLGANVEMASIEQVLEEQLDFRQSPLEVCGTTTAARTLLGCLKVPGECLNRPLGSLSGGERTKVAMAMILNARANLLLLDEPTNHLEIEAQEALEAALRIYPGTVIAVSHDRAFLEALGDDAKRIELRGQHGGTLRGEGDPYEDRSLSASSAALDVPGTVVS